MPTAVKSAVVSQTVLAVYLQAVEWIPLGEWNNVAKGNGQESLDLILVVLQAAVLISYWRHWRLPMIGGLGLYGLWLYVEIRSWWIPYFHGASPRMMRFYEHWFANTYKFLPPIDGHPIPDAEHTVILGLLLLVLACSLVAVNKTLQRKGTGIANSEGERSA